jgi:hypothetical protein
MYGNINQHCQEFVLLIQLLDGKTVRWVKISGIKRSLRRACLVHRPPPEFLRSGHVHKRGFFVEKDPPNAKK